MVGSDRLNVPAMDTFSHEFGCARCSTQTRCPLLGWGAPLPIGGGWGGGSTPTCMAQNDPHVALIILTTHMWGKMCW